ncbi:hypothetical protein JYU34_018936 [Plutella xylostella]|uniref:Uncharacterized protein n=1 Tax=Plutella xylostella TaxID=51655 RepID=A0ABQ7PZ52_PLUXY|nr:hypothetical protein JYU34_018936 [Plutella xylostella]
MIACYAMQKRPCSPLQSPGQIRAITRTDAPAGTELLMSDNPPLHSYTVDPHNQQPTLTTNI